MAVLSVHNFYRSANPSGENLVVERERALMAEHGRPYRQLDRHSDELLNAGLLSRLRLGLQLGPNRARQDRLRRALATHRDECDILHLHNPWPLFTYDLVVAAKELGYQVVQTLHNYRLVASDSHFLGRDGARRPRNAQERLHLRRMPAMHGSRLRNLVYTRALAEWWRRGVPLEAIDRYVCLTSFQAGVMAAAGIPEQRIVCKPNFVPDRPELLNDRPGDHALFVGRLSPEKGLSFLCRWWPETGLPLTIIGDGPLAGRLPQHPLISFRGAQPFDAVLRAMASARILVHSSNWYETFGLVLVEAMAVGTPSLTPDFGVMPEVIDHGRLGACYADGDGPSFIDAARQLWQRAPLLRGPCRDHYLQHYTPERNAGLLDALYDGLQGGPHA
jgi:glycosyltransferase involved in cell wall biosynthesis